MNEKGLKPYLYRGLSYNEYRDVASERKRQWDGLVIRALEKKKPYNFDTYQDMIYTYDRRDGKTPYPNSRKETVIPVGSFQSQRASFDGLDPSPYVSQEVSVPVTVVPEYYYPADNSDDLTVDTYYSSINTTRLWWYYPAFEKKRYGIIRFPNIIVEQGAVVKSATLSLFDNGSSSPQSTIVYTCLSDNATAPASYAEYTTLSWSSASTTITYPWTDGDVLAPVQEIIDRGGFASGNAIMFRIHSDAQGPYINKAYSYDDGIAAYYPTLYIGL